MNKTVTIHEFYKGEWTFHTKGMWFYENSEENPSLSLIGSSNYSQRSYKRDNEIQFFIYSLCPKFKEKLHKENEKMFENSVKIGENEIKNDKEVIVKFRHKVLFWLMKSFL